MEGTSLGIAENNAEVVAAIAPFAKEVRNSQSSLCESLGSLREYVLVGVEPPSKDVHASPASIHSSLGVLSGLCVDLLEEENSAHSLNEDDSEWDDDKRLHGGRVFRPINVRWERLCNRNGRQWSRVQKLVLSGGILSPLNFTSSVLTRA